MAGSALVLLTSRVIREVAVPVFRLASHEGVMVKNVLVPVEAPISFADKLAASESFKTLFRDGMNLVEEAAAYLDGTGREDARALPRLVALAYAAESMRLTTRLMQLASWLLLQRAVNEGELTQGQAADEKHKIRLVEQDLTTHEDTRARMPAELCALIERSLRLQARVLHLDTVIYNRPPVEEANPARPLEGQLELLRAAFASA
jgi:regulator of CtrA degradation